MDIFSLYAPPIAVTHRYIFTDSHTYTHDHKHTQTHSHTHTARPTDTHTLRDNNSNTDSQPHTYKLIYTQIDNLTLRLTLSHSLSHSLKNTLLEIQAYSFSVKHPHPASVGPVVRF